MAHLQRLERLTAPQFPISNELHQLLQQLRWRLGLERLALYAVRGTFASGLTLLALAAAAWLAEGDRALLWLASAPALAAAVFAVFRWPSGRSAAVAADRRYGLDERLATAAELMAGERQSRFSAMQLRDALEHASARHGGFLLLDRRARNEALGALAAALFAAATVVLLPRVPRPTLEAQTPPVESIADVAPVADDPAQRALPLDMPETTAVVPQAERTAAQGADLAARVQQEQAERSALDKLAQALSTISAGQPAADAIQQGDFSGARDQLQNLADNADQLSDAAKQQLAHGLQQAAAATSQTDAALAQREQQAAQALSRSTYDQQRQALRNLADQVQRSSARSVPSDQLERDVGQLQQQTAGAAQASASGAQPSSGAGQSASASTRGQTSQASAAQGAGNAQGVSGQDGNGQGDQNGAGIGTGTDPNLFSDQPSRLDTAGQQVQVPLKLGSGPGARPADGTEDQAVPDPRLSGRTASELSQTQQTGQVAPEQNLVPGEQRPVVRGYFR